MTQFAPGFAPKDLLNLMTSSPVTTGLAHEYSSFDLSNLHTESDVQTYIANILPNSPKFAGSPLRLDLCGFPVLSMAFSDIISTCLKPSQDYSAHQSFFLLPMQINIVQYVFL